MLCKYCYRYNEGNYARTPEMFFAPLSSGHKMYNSIGGTSLSSPALYNGNFMQNCLKNLTIMHQYVDIVLRTFGFGHQLSNKIQSVMYY